MPEISIRLFSQHLMQGVWCIILALLFLYTFNVYRKHYLKIWAFSWWAFALYLLTAAAILQLMWVYPVHHPIGVSLTVLSICAAYTQTVLLFVGTWELINEKKFKKSQLYLFLLLTVALAVLSSIVFLNGANASEERFFARVGIRAIITGIGFLATGIWIITTKSTSKGLGKKLLTVAFIIFGLEQINYFVVGLLPLLGIEYEFTYITHLGLLDFFLQALIGMGMVIWLLENERRDLKKANADLDSFFYSTSHDLRSPIASILGLTYLAKHQSKDQETLEIFERIEGRIQKLDEVINDILNYSKNSKRTLNITKLNFNVLLDDVIGSIKFVKGASAIRLDYIPNEKNLLNGDKDRLVTILNNLISNSVKYHDLSKADPYIRVSFHKSGGMARITIADNGSGIDPKDQAKVFDMFYRASTDSQGSGLGLFIVKEAVKKLNGTITLESAPRVGSTFKVVIPDLEP
ncbi:HAMP domain-containing histidine kinase [Fulvivirga sp. 29W222]|uniref:histidine kinase n=1 Tax=Fulvivirga marina TaxID=2494733 RepID=A0A937FYS9_9BACT|nr:HAMP domain-containing sensor histidine kinase [Fulvivirga marina]MBL6447502.1 HAMP domain-containing histidine kinase [Fulvivirga marina]